jgi:ABC-type dipeptide/oligopeptide/nickel transport system ATPase subunit
MITVHWIGRRPDQSVLWDFRDSYLSDLSGQGRHEPQGRGPYRPALWRSAAEYWRDVQAVFQDPFSAFNQFFTVGKLLERSMLMVGKKVGQERLEESLGYVGMDLSVLDRYPRGRS